MAGLTRDKQMEAEAMETAMMTGCGSVLWMAPEILVADRYAMRLSAIALRLDGCSGVVALHSICRHGRDVVARCTN